MLQIDSLNLQATIGIVLCLFLFLSESRERGPKINFSRLRLLAIYSAAFVMLAGSRLTSLSDRFKSVTSGVLLQNGNVVCDEHKISMSNRGVVADYWAQHDPFESPARKTGRA